MISRSIRFSIVIIGVCVLLAAHALPCTAATRKLIVVVANRLTLSDLDNPSLPTISRMLNKGSIGLISPNCIGPKNESAVMLTAGAGTPCRGAGTIGEFYQTNERTLQGVLAGDAYTLMTGRRTAQDSGVFLGLAAALRANKELINSGGQLGALGEALEKAGKKTCVIGSADRIRDIIDRSTAVLAMDSSGKIDHCWFTQVGKYAWWKEFHTSGDANASLFCEYGQPATMSSILGRNIVSLLHSADYAVINFGDTTRLDEYKPGISNTACAARKASVMKELDAMLDYLGRQPQLKDARIALVSFSPPTGILWSRLTPIIVYPAARPGLLLSPATRTPGLIAASDFAPTVLSILGVSEAQAMVGRPAREVAFAHNLEAVHYIDERVNTNRIFLLPLGIFITVISATAFTIGALIIVFGLRPSKRILSVLQAGLMVPACVPVALLLDVLAPTGIVGYVIGTLIPLVVMVPLCIGLAALLARRVSVRGLPVVIAYSIGSAVVFIDAIFGGSLNKFSGPSSFQISGMRFYGIGNEFAGLYIGMAATAILFTGGKKSASRLTRWAAAITGILSIIMFGAGSIGANYGATAAAVVTTSLLGMAIRRRGFKMRHVTGALTLGIFSVAAFAVIDWKTAGAASTHGGRVTGMFESLGPAYVAAIAVRKVLMNLAITFSPVSRRIIFSFVPFMFLWQIRLWPKVKEIFCDELRIIAGLKAIAIGAITAYMFNDSGIVFACLLVGMVMLILIYSLLEDLQVSIEHAHAREEAAICPES